MKMSYKELYLRNTKPELKDYSGRVLICSPDRFPVQDWLEAEQQLTFERAFEMFFINVERVFSGDKHKLSRERMLQLLRESYVAYVEGNSSLGARKIREFRVEAGFSKSAD